MPMEKKPTGYPSIDRPQEKFYNEFVVSQQGIRNIDIKNG